MTVASIHEKFIHEFLFLEPSAEILSHKISRYRVFAHMYMLLNLSINWLATLESAIVRMLRES